MSALSIPTVSVLTTVYNYGTYLDDAVASVLASTWQDWELIIVDDCSSDDSLARAQKWEVMDPHVRVIANAVNMGDYPARNLAASHARGRYLKYLDADDIIYPHSLAIMVESMARFPEAALGLSYNVIDDDRPYPQQVSPREAYRSFFLGRDVLAVGPSAAIIRRDSFERAGGFGRGQYVGDTELWLKLAAVAPVVKLQPALVWWRRHERQQINEEQRNPSILAARHRLALDALGRSGHLLSPDERRLARALRIHRQARSVLNTVIRHRSMKAARIIWLESGLTLGDMAMAFCRPGCAIA